MPTYEATRAVDIEAPAAACFAVLTDYERMPEWQARVTECRVVSHDAEGRPSEVDYAVDARLRTVRYRLRHLYDEPRWIGSEYVSGDFKRFEGDYALDERSGTTHVTFKLRIDPGLRVPGPIAKMLNEAVMGRALEDLKARVEAVANGA